MSQALIAQGSKNGLILDDWTTVGKICAKGLAEKYYDVGDYKPVDLGDEGVINFKILGFGLTSNTSIDWFAEDLLKTKQKYNQSNSASPVYQTSYLRSYMQSTIWNKLPSDLRKVIVDELWIPSYNSLCSGGKYYEVLGTPDQRAIPSQDLSTAWWLASSKGIGSNYSITVASHGGGFLTSMYTWNALCSIRFGFCT